MFDLDRSSVLVGVHKFILETLQGFTKKQTNLFATLYLGHANFGE